MSYLLSFLSRTKRLQECSKTGEPGLGLQLSVVLRFRKVARQAIPLSSSVAWRQAAAEAAAAAAAEREREVAALRAQQERALDRRAELDELRARRCALPAHLSGTAHMPA